MDGSLAVETGRRATLKAPIGCVGVGLHSGLRASLTLRPAEAGSGIVFRRTDLGIDIRSDDAAWPPMVVALPQSSNPGAGQ